MINKNKINISHKKGSALISSLVAVALFGVSGAALFHYMSNFQTTVSQTVERVSVSPVLRNAAINNMKSILVEKSIDNTGRKSRRNEHGICSLVKAPTLGQGVEPIKLDLSQISRKMLTDEPESRWKAFFPQSEWELADISHCQRVIPNFSNTPYRKCFQYLGSRSNIANQIVYVIVEIVLFSFPGLGVVDPSTITAQNRYIDPKAVIFRLKASAFTSNAPSPINNPDNPDDNPDVAQTSSYLSHSSDILWANDVGNCHVRNSSNDWVVVRMSATGTGSTLQGNILNSPLYSEDTHNCNKLQISELNSDVVQVGSLENVDLFSITRLNARIACTKNKFSCKQKIKVESLEADSYDDLVFSFNLFNKSFSDIQVAGLDVAIKDKDNNELDNTNNGKLDRVQVEYGISQDSVSQRDFAIPRGFQSVNLTVKNKPGSTRLSSYCHNICQNYDPNNSSTYRYPSISIREKGGQNCTFEKDYNSSEGNRIRCIVCHTKACHRYGLRTFGPLDNELRTIRTQNLPPEQNIIYGLDDEPLDGQIPECAVKHSYNLANNQLPPNSTGSRGEAGTECKGMAMRITSIDSFKNMKNNDYIPTGCDEELPVLCFVNGQYMPALRINNSNRNSVSLPAKSDFHNANKTCFEVGREIGSANDLARLMYNAYRPEYKNEDLDFFFNRVNNTLRSLPFIPESFNFTTSNNSTNNFDFINNASRGMFLFHPFGDRPQLREKVRNNIIRIINEGGRVWTALEWDAEGQVVASPPWALVAKDHPYALFYDKRVSKGHRPVLLKDATEEHSSYNPFSPATAGHPESTQQQQLALRYSSPYFSLTHNIRYKGLLPASANARLNFVCKRKSDSLFFITRETGSLSAGPRKCKNEDGIFVPPETGLDWAKLMWDLNNNDDHYPFPDPGISDTDVVDGIFEDPSMEDLLTGNIGTRRYRSLLYRKKVESGRRAWVALEKKTSRWALERGPRARDLRLYKEHFPGGSIFREHNKSRIINRLSSGTDAPLIISSNGAVKTEGYRFHNLDEITVDNAQSLKKGNLSDYKKVCLSTEKGERIPKQLVNFQNSCPSGTEQVDIGRRNNTLFKPTSYKYMSYWLKNIGNSDTENIILQLSVLEEQINAYNRRIDELKRRSNRRL